MAQGFARSNAAAVRSSAASSPQRPTSWMAIVCAFLSYGRMTDETERHFQQTTGAMPESAAMLRRHAPDLFKSYAETRARLYRPPPEGHLDLRAKELVFIVLDVVAGHVDGACAHAAAGLAAGLTAGQIMEALEICILIHGHHTWASAGMAVMGTVERLAQTG